MTFLLCDKLDAQKDLSILNNNLIYKHLQDFMDMQYTNRDKCENFCVTKAIQHNYVIYTKQ